MLLAALLLWTAAALAWAAGSASRQSPKGTPPRPIPFAHLAALRAPLKAALSDGPETKAPAAAQYPKPLAFLGRAHAASRQATPARGARQTKPPKHGEASARPGPLPERLRGSALLKALDRALEDYDEDDIDALDLEEAQNIARELWEGAGAGAAYVLADAPYLRNQISEARFGVGDRKKLLAKARRLAQTINRSIIGEELAANILQDRVVQYLESLGSRTKDPVALHLIGLPGIGKSDLLSILEAIGLPVLRIDAQRYVQSRENFADDLSDALHHHVARNPPQPLIVAIEEIDKLPEKAARAEGVGEETTNSLIGTLNQILSDGKLSPNGSRLTPLNLSHVFFLTTMNFSPAEIERFSGEALRKKKSYYDFTVEDFQEFDAWVRRESSAKYKVLSNLFRANTVSRLAPNAVIMNPLGRGDYTEIARLMIARAVERTTQGPGAAKRLAVFHTKAFLKFIARETAYAPSGARETVYRADALVEQLIGYGTKAAAVGDRSLDRPRRLVLDYDPTTRRAWVTVVPLLRRGKAWSDGPSFRFPVPFDPAAGLFRDPGNTAHAPPPAAKSRAKERGPKPLSKKKIIELRFPKSQYPARGLALRISERVIGQEETTRLVEGDMNAYLGRHGPAIKEPSTRILAGFPGIGKTEIVMETAEHLDMPIIRVNLQNHSSDDSKVVQDFMDTVNAALDKAQRQSRWKGKYILLIEELDKVHEIDETGKTVDRPIMGVIKDILNNGEAQITTEGRFEPSTRTLDLRDAFIFVTMNFAVDRFGFEADPRMTSVKDTRDAWKELKTRLADMKRLMGSMFLPETVSRLMARLQIMAPLTEEDYRRVIGLQAEEVSRVRLADAGEGTEARIRLRLTPAYRRYLFAETVVPSEGARYTSNSSRIKITGDLERALKSLKRSADYAAKPIEILLDYKPGSRQVVGLVRRTDRRGAKSVKIFEQKVPLFFPPLRAYGRLEPERVTVALHEFGHAYVAARLGLRFEHVVAVPPENGVGGYVKPAKMRHTARSLLARVYMSLGSRALERIFLSRDPRDRRSVLEITPGPMSDIKQATELLFKMLHEWGLDPDGGTLDRKGASCCHRYANFSDLPASEVEKLGRVLREMEDQLILDLLEAHPREWHMEKIARFARVGGMTEEEFYGLIGRPHPGPEPENEDGTVAFLGEVSPVLESFRGIVKPTPKQFRAALEFREGPGGLTAAGQLEAYRARFEEILARVMHPAPPPAP